jgi:hypothetical protein
VGAVLVASGVLLAPRAGVWEAVGLVALGQGLGLLVAAVFIALDRNPFQRREH